MRPRMCPKCRLSSSGNAFGQPWEHCSFDDVDTVPLFTGDDLVTVAIEAFAVANVERDAAAFVDEMLKDEVFV